MSNAEKRPFIPRDKPKSWIVFIIAALVALFFGGPILFISTIYDLSFALKLGIIIFASACTVGIVMWCVFAVGMLRGKYGSLDERPWSEQVW